jgi:hypothetical protein
LNAGKLASSYEKVAEQVRLVRVSLKKVQEESKIDAEKFFPKAIVEQIDKAGKAMETYNNSISNGLKNLKA